MPVATRSPEALAEIARQIRKDVCVMTNRAQSGHAGGPLSAADYLTYLFFNELHVDPAHPDMAERDRFIMSNGHCSALNYALLAHRGYFNRSYLLTFRTTESKLQGHPNRLKVPGLEASTGSIGHGLSIGLGIAFGLRIAKSPARVFVNLGDGEMQEGSIWEAIMAAGHYRMDNLIATVDWNNAQIDGKMRDVMNIEPIPAKLRDFHWHVETADGHDWSDIQRAYEACKQVKGMPKAIVFRTIMMKGVKPLEDNYKWHGKPLDNATLDMALKELGFDEDTDAAIAGYGKVAFH